MTESSYAHISAVAVAAPTDLGRDGNQLYSKTGKPFTTLRVAIRKATKEEETIFADASIYNEGLRESAKREIHKGSRVVIEGLKTQRTVGDRTYVNIMVNDLGLVQGLDRSVKAPVAAEEF